MVDTEHGEVISRHWTERGARWRIDAESERRAAQNRRSRKHDGVRVVLGLPPAASPYPKPVPWEVRHLDKGHVERGGFPRG